MAPAGKPTHDSDGIELTFAVNHVNQALLFFLLKEKNLLGPRCRFVWLTSATHDPKQPMNQGPAYWPDTETVAEATDSKLEASFVRYSTAKLGTIFFSYVLASKIKEARQSSMQQWTSIIYEPGFTPGGGSRLQRGKQVIQAKCRKRLLQANPNGIRRSTSCGPLCYKIHNSVFDFPFQVYGYRHLDTCHLWQIPCRHRFKPNLR